ncbi:nucleic acid-binding protein [Durotheca rogersii]|uniref:nucleic acid-binding protein n=1 Tax=Durotheca rogersii TaxID=419775 RepID=UPI0022207FEF|nr:nucleic acid-binding protein [Durotheca rogersii]KAI5864525.1 nucleic acid-binding protein [Durotheca rogersii]
MSFFTRRAFTAPASLSRLAAPAATARAFSASARRDIAKITIVGNLAGPPQARATSTGHEILEYLVASNAGRGEDRKTSWFRVTAFVEEGPRRDFLTSLTKGALVYVEGDASLRTYTDGEEKPRTSLSIVLRNLDVIRKPTPPPDSEQ